MPRTRGKQEIKPVSKTSLDKFTCAEKNIGGNSGKSDGRTSEAGSYSYRSDEFFR